MAEARIPADLFNPGQVFACLGLIEAAEVLLGDAGGAFDWESAPETTFILRAAGDEDPLEVVLDFLLQAQVESLPPHNSANRTGKWDVPTTVLAPQAPSPAADPASPATLPVRLSAHGASLIIDYWMDGLTVSGRDNAKFWAGSGGYPGAALLRDALALLRSEPQRVRGELFDFSTPQSSSFRLDWRRDYVPLDAGFSLNAHSNIVTVGYPLVEILAAIGLSHARPLRLENKLNYRYGAPGLPQISQGEASPSLYPPMFLRAALGCAGLPFPMRLFRMRLDWPGQEGQARCITHVYEETEQ